MEIFIEADGEVVISDLLDDLLPVARRLDDAASPACPVPPVGSASARPPGDARDSGHDAGHDTVHDNARPPDRQQ